MQKFVAEFVGTLTLVLFGCGAAVLGADNVGQLGIALAFGFAIVAMPMGSGRSPVATSIPPSAWRPLPPGG